MTHECEFDREAIYRIRVKGTLDPEWADWFGGLEVVSQKGDETLLVGPVADQAALYGLLTKIRNLGLPLLSVVRIKQAP
ncbi:MAG TPA: hypothetical protein VM366_10625 [Anaerolineae bacterium]|nr:hypothetical protein [Anaerolineae bacterium]